ncbi:MAG: hypothetical protein Q8N17_03870 [Burkholderiaceae bacterium]|nr:hypothetical protein [Burkholderiaceae bacterium]
MSLALHLDANGGLASMVGLSGNTSSPDLQGLFENLRSANVLQPDFMSGKAPALQVDSLGLSAPRDEAREPKASPDFASLMTGLQLDEVIRPHAIGYFGPSASYERYGISGCAAQGPNGGEHLFGVANIPHSGDVEELRLLWDLHGRITLATTGSQRPLSKECLALLYGMGIIQPALLTRWGISLKDVDEIVQTQQASRGALEKQLVRDAFTDLPPCGEKAARNPVHVRQGHAAFIVPGGAVGMLGTDRASCCCILIAVETGKDMKVSHVGMAHVDPAGVQGPEALDLFFSSMKTHAASRIGVHIISGSYLTASNVLEAANRAGAEVCFSAANLPGKMPYGAVVNDKGEVFRDTPLVLQRLSDESSKLDGQRVQRIMSLSLDQFQMQDKLQFTHYN